MNEKCRTIQALLKETTIFNLAVIDNIDFKEKSFEFGNIYDITRGTSHAILRIAFQFTLPEIINKIFEPIRELSVDIQLFGIFETIYKTIYKLNKIFENLLVFQFNKEKKLEYN